MVFIVPHICSSAETTCRQDSEQRASPRYSDGVYLLEAPASRFSGIVEHVAKCVAFNPAAAAEEAQSPGDFKSSAKRDLFRFCV